MKRTIVQEFGEANRPPLVRGYANAKVGHSNKKAQTHRIWALLGLQSEPLELCPIVFFLRRKELRFSYLLLIIMTF
jgi:hypothetical protein